LRFDAVERFTNEFEDLDPNSFVIFSGDLNLYSSTEPAYVELLNPENPITLTDPISTPGAWSNNSNFQEVHTQSTRVSSGPFGAGAGGGLDDRFDFMMISENMLSNPKLRYVADTYFAYGNNGNCFNGSINEPGCGGTFSVSLREDLYNMSDHLPVVMELETSEEIVILSSNENETSNNFVVTQTLVSEYVPYQSNTDASLHFELYNIVGQKVTEFSVKSRENGILDVSYVANGVYFLKEISSKVAPIKILKR